MSPGLSRRRSSHANIRSQSRPITGGHFFASLRVLASLREILSCLAYTIRSFQKTRDLFRAKTPRLAKIAKIGKDQQSCLTLFRRVVVPSSSFNANSFKIVTGF